MTNSEQLAELIVALAEETEMKITGGADRQYLVEDLCARLYKVAEAIDPEHVTCMAGTVPALPLITERSRQAWDAVVIE